MSRSEIPDDRPDSVLPLEEMERSEYREVPQYRQRPRAVKRSVVQEKSAIAPRLDRFHRIGGQRLE
jgi:hypothetical protein